MSCLYSPLQLAYLNIFKSSCSAASVTCIIVRRNSSIQTQLCSMSCRGPLHNILSYVSKKPVKWMAEDWANKDLGISGFSALHKYSNWLKKVAWNWKIMNDIYLLFKIQYISSICCLTFVHFVKKWHFPKSKFCKAF